VIKQEEEAFAETLEQGLKDFYERVRRLKDAGQRVIPGDEIFFLYDTRGLPLEIVEDLAMENGLLVDEAGFNQALEQQRERSRQDYMTGKIRQQVAQAIFDGKTRFVGYDYSVGVTAGIRAILIDGERAESIDAGQSGEIVLDSTPFYAEAGGQVGDTGVLIKDGVRALVKDTHYRGATITHAIEVESGRLQLGDEVEASVDLEKRRMTMKNHTATHLLHAALKKVLGPHVKQAGSLVAPDRLRFDFTHFAPLSAAEIQAVEDEVNYQIWSDVEVETHLMDLDSAMQSGAVALFGEKYQEEVRVVEVPGYSKELCGGTHVPATGTIGAFKIVSENGIAAGIRRLEALTGPGALERFREDERLLDTIQADYKVGRQEIPAFIEKLQGQIRDLQRQVSELKVQSARSALAGVAGQMREVQGVKVLAQMVPETDRTGLRSLADELKNKLGSGVVILGTPQDGKAALVVMVSGDLCQRLPAGKIIKQIATLVGGSGGGKAELAEAGGKDPGRLAEAIEKSYGIVEDMLAQTR
jgi:alanyl-tRNA synthetase